MQNSQDTMKKAKKCINKYKLSCLMLSISFALTFALLVFLFDSSLITKIIGFVFALLISGIIFVIGGPVVFNKCIVSIVSKDLDPDTYLSAIRIGNFDTVDATWQILGEYYCGNYNNVVSICKTKLEDPNMLKRYKYTYLTYLANVYFEVGDDENLRKVCEQFETYLSKEIEQKQPKFRKQFPRMTFYDLYLKNDIDACFKWLSAPTPLKLNQAHRSYSKAKLLYMQGKKDEARSYCEKLAQELPQTNYGKLSIKLISDFENNNLPDNDVSLDAQLYISDEPQSVKLYPRNRSRLTIALFLIGIALIVVGITLMQA